MSLSYSSEKDICQGDIRYGMATSERLVVVLNRIGMDKVYIVMKWTDYEGEYEVNPTRVFRNKSEARVWVDKQPKHLREGFFISDPFEVE